MLILCQDSPIANVPSENHLPISAVTLPELSLTAHTPSEIQASQLEDPTIGPILQSRERNQPPQISQADSLPHRRLAQLWDQLTVREGVLYRLFLGPDDACNHLQLVIPYNLRVRDIRSVTWRCGRRSSGA